MVNANNMNLSYIRYYRSLSERYDSPASCETPLKNEFINNTNQKFRTAYNIDIDSKLGTYLQVNPELQTPSYKNSTFDIERIHLTWFATPRIPRESRICRCGEDVQTLRYVLMYCPVIIRNAEVPTFPIVVSFFVILSLMLVSYHI